MSNQEEQPKASDGRSLDDIFHDLKGSNPLSEEDAASITGVAKAPLEVSTEAPKAKFKFEAPKLRAEKTAEARAEAIKTQITPESIAATESERISFLEQEILKLKQGQVGIKLGSVSAKEKRIKLDFTKIDETSVYDLNVPIEAIEHEVPDYTKIVLKDATYIPRWVQVHPARLGPMRQAGFTYITAEDLAEELVMDLEADENGHYRFIDLVAMKCSKDKYFGALRRNYVRALAQTNPKIVHQMAKQTVEGAMTAGISSDGTKAPMGQATSYARHKEAGHIGVFSPNLVDTI